MKIALAQINPTVGDFARNSAKILDFAARASRLGADLAVFPEMCICGYPPKDLLLKESFVEANLEAIHKLAEQSLKNVPGLALVVGYIDRNYDRGRPLHNAAAYISKGKIDTIQYKTLLPTYDVFDEDRYFEPATKYTLAQLSQYKLGLSICEDTWTIEDLCFSNRYRVDPINKLAQLGAEIFVNISASPFTIGKQYLREELIRQHALKHKKPFLYVNQVGGNDELIFDGASFIVDAHGSCIARAKSFAEDILIVEADEQLQHWTSITSEDNRNLSPKVIIRKTASLEKPGSEPEIYSTNEAAVYSALVLGTRDYIQKCGFKQVILGLSGGIDSAVTCVIACQAIGKENVLGIAMPSPHSSPSSLLDGKELAQNLGINFRVIPIDSIMQAYDKALLPEFQGTDMGTAEENIQARIRGTILMALSNKFNYLLLTTGNKSELAVGYCTLYGDMCGGLAVISDLPKTQVYALANYINKQAKKAMIPLRTIEKAPSAELRPNQTDQDTLPPYLVLDGIINAYVEKHLNPSQIIALGYPEDVVKDILSRIDHNEYKRKQAAPGLKVTSRAFGLGWRMPIAQKFQKE